MSTNLKKLKILRSYLLEAFQTLEHVEYFWEENSFLSQPDQTRESISEILDLLERLIEIIEADIQSSERRKK